MKLFWFSAIFFQAILLINANSFRKKCADVQCSKKISNAIALNSYVPIERSRDYVQFKKSDNLIIYGKNVDANDNYWLVQAPNGQRGLAPKKFLREASVLIGDLVDGTWKRNGEIQQKNVHVNDVQVDQTIKKEETELINEEMLNIHVHEHPKMEIIPTNPESDQTKSVDNNAEANPMLNDDLAVTNEINVEDIVNQTIENLQQMGVNLKDVVGRTVTNDQSETTETTSVSTPVEVNDLNKAAPEVQLAESESHKLVETVNNSETIPKTAEVTSSNLKMLNNFKTFESNETTETTSVSTPVEVNDLNKAAPEVQLAESESHKLVETVNNSETIPKTAEVTSSNLKMLNNFKTFESNETTETTSVSTPVEVNELNKAAPEVQLAESESHKLVETVNNSETIPKTAEITSSNLKMLNNFKTFESNETTETTSVSTPVEVNELNKAAPKVQLAESESHKLVETVNNSETIPKTAEITSSDLKMLNNLKTFESNEIKPITENTDNLIMDDKNSEIQESSGTLNQNDILTTTVKNDDSNIEAISDATEAPFNVDQSTEGNLLTSEVKLSELKVKEMDSNFKQKMSLINSEITENVDDNNNSPPEVISEPSDIETIVENTQMETADNDTAINENNPTNESLESQNADEIISEPIPSASSSSDVVETVIPSSGEVNDNTTNDNNTMDENYETNSSESFKPIKIPALPLQKPPLFNSYRAPERVENSNEAPIMANEQVKSEDSSQTTNDHMYDSNESLSEKEETSTESFSDNFGRNFDQPIYHHETTTIFTDTVDDSNDVNESGTGTVEELTFSDFQRNDEEIRGNPQETKPKEMSSNVEETSNFWNFDTISDLITSYASVFSFFSTDERALVTTDHNSNVCEKSRPLSVFNASDRELILFLICATIITFLLGFYGIESLRRDWSLASEIDTLQRHLTAVLIEAEHAKEDLTQMQEKLLSENEDGHVARIIELEKLKKELDEANEAKLTLEEQNATLERELETMTETGLELNRMVAEVLKNNQSSDSLSETVQIMQKQLNDQQRTIAELGITVGEKDEIIAQQNGNVEQLQTKLDDLTRSFTEITEKSAQLAAENAKLQIQIRTIETMEQQIAQDKSLVEKLTLKIKNLHDTIAKSKEKIKLQASEIAILTSNYEKINESSENVAEILRMTHLQAQCEQLNASNKELSYRLEKENESRVSLEKNVIELTGALNDMKKQLSVKDGECIEAKTRLEVLSKYFEEKEAQLTKELVKQQNLWLENQGEADLVTTRIQSMQDEISSYRNQNEALKKEIVDQEVSLKSQISVMEQKAHENWLQLRQVERKLEESKHTASQLRNRLIFVEQSNTSNMAAKDYRMMSPLNFNGDANGEAVSPAPPFASLPFALPGALPPPLPLDDNVLQYLPPPPGVQFMPPPPGVQFLPPPVPFPGNRRPPPLGRMSSPPPDPRALNYSPSHRRRRERAFSPHSSSPYDDDSPYDDGEMSPQRRHDDYYHAKRLEFREEHARGESSHPQSPVSHDYDKDPRNVNHKRRNRDV